jgi:hypothetical protein
VVDPHDPYPDEGGGGGLMEHAETDRDAPEQRPEAQQLLHGDERHESLIDAF